MKTSTLLWLLLFLNLKLFAQSSTYATKADSLYSILPRMHDTLQVETLMEMGQEKLPSSKEEGIALFYKAIEKAKEIDYPVGLAYAYALTGTYQVHYFNDFNKAKLFLDSALSIKHQGRKQRQILYLVSMWHSMKGELEISHQYLTEAIRINGKKNDATTALLYEVMGYNLGKIGRKRESIIYFKKATGIYKDLNKTRSLAAVLNNTSQAYMDLEEYDSAQHGFEQVYAIEKQFGNPLDNPSLLQNLGTIFLNRNQPDTAYRLFHAGLAAAKRSNLQYAIQMGYSGLGFYHLNHSLDSALFYGRSLLSFSKGTQYSWMEDANLILSNAHAQMAHFDSAYIYQKNYIAFHDSLLQEKAMREIAELEIKFDVEKKAAEIEALQMMRKNEVWQRRAIYIIWALTLLIAIEVILIFRSRIQAKKKELNQKNIQLMQYTRTMLEKTEMADRLNAELKQFQESQSTTYEKSDKISQIMNLAILTDDDWEEFKLLFEQAHKNFFADLRIKFPDLTAAETRLAALLKLNLSTREMANMLGISVESANKARYRLRKKLDIPHEKDLKEFLDEAVEVDT
jgi:DNA-binding CsgD family transcriptional regulator